MLQGKYPLLVALVLGLMAGLISYSAIQSQQRSVVREWSTVQVLCATTEIERGTEIDENLVGACEIPEKFVTESFFVLPEDGGPMYQLPYGQKVLVPLHAGDPLLYSHFEAVRDFKLAESIPHRARAIAVEVDAKASVNRWIRANDHVDVLGSFRDPDTRDLVTVTLMQNVIVLATGSIHADSTYASDDDKQYNHVVLLVTQEEAEVLALAQESGNLTMTLRHPEDLEEPTEVAARKTDYNTLMTGEAQRRKARDDAFQGRLAVPAVEIPRPRAPSGPQIEVIEGTQRRQQTGQLSP